MPPKRKAVLLEEDDSKSVSNNNNTTTSTSTSTSTTTTTTNNSNNKSNDNQNSNGTDSSIQTLDGTHIFWYWKETEINWVAFSPSESVDIDKLYITDPKSNAYHSLNNGAINIKFDEMKYHTGDIKNVKQVKRSEMVAVWSWEKARGEFYSFEPDTSKKIEVAHKKGQSKVSIDAERYINLSTFEQVRFDNESKTRRVSRCFVDITPLASPAWFFEDQGKWTLFKDTQDVEKKFQQFLKYGKSTRATTPSDQKIIFTTMSMEDGSPNKFIKIKRDNGPVSALTKSYSQLSEEEKKQLIASLMANGGNNNNDNNQVTKKQKVNNNALYLPGEEELLDGKKVMKYILKPVRHFDNSIADLHFRTAESQFYRLLESASSTYKVRKVEYIVNPTLVKKFQAKKEEFEASGNPGTVFGFHGTASKNINSICTNNFSVPGNNGVKHATDSGWYGKGIYFSEYPEYSIGYISDCNKLLLCKVLLGKSYKCSGLITGQPCKTGYTSHLSPDEKELVIFHPDQILPLYIVHYGSDDDDNNDIGSGKCYTLYNTAKAKKATNIFSNVKVCLGGSLTTTHYDIHSLVSLHGGGHSSYVTAGVTHMVVTKSEYQSKSTKVSTAEGSNIPIVSEKWLYDSINQGSLLPTTTYSYTFQQASKKHEIKAVPLDDDGSSLINSAASGSSSVGGGGSTLDGTTTTKPPCKYGDKCYRKNADHFKSFSHPFLIE